MVSPDVQSAAAGALLSLLVSYFPPLRRRYEALDGGAKRLAMGAALLLVSLAGLGLSCLGLADLLPDPGVVPACTRPGVGRALSALVHALVANQAVYLLTPKPEGSPQEARHAAS